MLIEYVVAVTEKRKSDANLEQLKAPEDVRFDKEFKSVDPVRFFITTDNVFFIVRNLEHVSSFHTCKPMLYLEAIQ